MTSPRLLASVVVLAAASILGLTACNNRSESASGQPRFAYVTNGVANFWTIAITGANKAGADLKVNVTAVTPNGMTDQTRKVEDLLTRGIDGIAISPIDPDNQADVINNAAAKTLVLTHDSDAPKTNRLVYIGMDNYKAGLECGKLVREALPNGGKVMIFVGRTEQDNARRRRQGTIDGILGRSEDSTRNDPNDVLKSDDSKYIILGTLTDQFDRVKAKANAEDALKRDLEIAAMVGLFEYNPPLILEALDRSGKLGKVQVIGFDEAEATLEGIKAGHVYGTIVQNPYMYGYKSIEVLNELKKGNKSIIPADKFINIPARAIKKNNVAEFQADLKAKLGGK
jgi:ribose transport system substrate-binding protein